MITFFDKKGKLNICEDSLTATVFDGLKYLPSQMFWRILRHSLYHNHLPEYSLCGEMVSISFWEKWSAEGENIDNVNFVEPDIFIRFKYIDVIIEAKRYNEKQQKIHQMNKEIAAYYNEFPNEGKLLYFIQCGGLLDKKDIKNYTYKDKTCFICKTDWTKLLDTIVTEKNRLNANNSSEAAQIRIFEDIIKGMELHQYYRKSWLSKLKPAGLNYISLKNTLLYARTESKY